MIINQMNKVSLLCPSTGTGVVVAVVIVVIVVVVISGL